jgi:hypothetical protein
MLLLFRIAKDWGCPVSELGSRLSWAEFLHWIAYYQREAEQALPPDKRPKRAATKEQAAALLDQAFGPFIKAT